MSSSWSTFIQMAVSLRIIRFNIQQDRHCGYDVTFRRFRATIVAVEKQQVCIFRVAFVAIRILQAMCMGHTVICGMSGSIIFFQHYLTNGTI